MEEREIRIVDLITEALLHWRVFIVWMIVGAVLLGVFSYVRSDDAARQQQTQTEAMLKGEPEEWFTEEEILNASYVAGYEKAYCEKGDYQQNSSFMQLNPNHVNKAEATVAVIAENREQSCDITKVYKDIVESGNLIEKVAKDADMDTIGVSELLYLKKATERTSANISIMPAEESNTFRITAVHNDEAVCRAMLDSAVTFIMEKQPGIQAVMGVHEVSVVSESFGVVSDMEIASRQKAVLSDVAAMKKDVSDAKKELTDRERQYYDLLKSGTTEEGQAPSEAPTPGVSAKYVLLGALIAAFLYAFILLLVYIFNTKIRATDSMQELYGIPQLGIIPAAPKRKKIFGVVDNWIISIRNHNKRQFTLDEALELVTVAAKMAAGKEALQDVCLMGCGMKEHSLEICEKIKNGLEKDGIGVKILNNVLYDAQMLEELAGMAGVILVESVGSTLYNEITEELELLKRQGIKALGGIVVE